MTREVAKREIESLDYYLQNHTNDYSEESHTAMVMAIKALEQEPNKEAYNQGYENGYLAGQKNVAEKCENAIHEAYMNAYDEQSLVRDLTQAVNDLPPVNPQELKTGHWIFDEILDKHYYCSECKSMGVDYWDFCPNCGAKMLEPQESEDKQ